MIEDKLLNDIEEYIKLSIIEKIGFILFLVENEEGNNYHSYKGRSNIEKQSMQNILQNCIKHNL